MTRIPFPAALSDAKPIVATITTDELLPIAGGIIVGVIVNNLTPFLAVGVAMVFVYRRVKEIKPKGFVRHWLYYHGLYTDTSKEFSDPFKRKWVG